MKKFNQEINLTIPVDLIAEMLLSRVSGENAELITSTIVGRMLATDTRGLSRLFAALNGYEEAITLEIGQEIEVNDVHAYGFWTPESISAGNSVRNQIYIAKVIELNIHRDNPVKIEYSVPRKDGTHDIKTEWINSAQVKR